MSNRDEARMLLKDTSWFKDASGNFLEELSTIMIPLEAEDGHVFIEEGHEVENVIVIERGKLRRSKLSANDEELEEFRLSLRNLPRHRRTQSLADTSVVVDELAGRGRTTGILNVIQEGNKAYATVKAVGPSKVWLIPGDDFRDLVTENPEHALEFMCAMSRELRVGSKSLRGLIKKVKKQSQSYANLTAAAAARQIRVLCYDSTSWVKDGFDAAIDAFNRENDCKIVMEYTSERLAVSSSTHAAGHDAVCLFVNDNADADVLQTLSLLGVKMIAMRCAGYDRVDTKAARAYGLTVARVPAYSPYAVAEMAIALLMAVNRKINKASNRVRMANFTLDSGLMGFDIHGKTVGILGTGKIGKCLCNIIVGFGANLICTDPTESEEVKAKGGVYVTKEELFTRSDVLFLMTPLVPETRHIISHEALTILKRGVILINTSRGALIDTRALLEGLRSGIVGGVGMDVYEHEQRYFFQDWSARSINDPDLEALLGNHNVVLTAHQAFFTKEAVDKIIRTTLENLRDYHRGLTGQTHPNNCVPALMQE